ncbi:peptidase S8/S53 domain-containing protein [Plectosphaerella cucumerina]|uniref:Peptidase S8/S53 domain-containing protein n=1 Tax=Plectosphaerella cucumerina TaxID=40658 RepID=A0A8K0TRA3_9PEZI|nr:peptidase S8/S53 domain-containing protein [Plectosphaerella cucumerina]
MLHKLFAASLTGLALARDLPLPDKANTASLVAPTRYIDTEGFYEAVKEVGVSVTPGLNFTSDIFHGASFDLANATAESVASIQDLGEIARVWPIEIYSLPTPEGNSSLRADDDDPPVMSNPDFKRFHPHLLTNVLEVHERGFNGSDVVVAVVDSGVDYNHPALGGGFGPGFRVEAGYDVVGPNFDPADPSAIEPNGDPMDCNGHGTHVAGILGSSWPQLIGVAPAVRLRSYKVFGCSPFTTSDYIMQGFILAFEGNPDIISASLGNDLGFVESPIVQVLNRISDAGVLVVAAIGNSGTQGPFFTSNTAGGHGVLSVGSAAVRNQIGYEIVAKSSSGNTRLMQYVSSDNQPWELEGTFKAHLPAVPRDFDICADSLPGWGYTVPDDEVLILPRGRALNCDSGWQLLDSWLIGVAKWAIYWNFEGREYETPSRVVYRPEDQAKGFATINYADGQWIEDEKEAGHSLTLEFKATTPGADRGAAYSSEFSSWGTTLDGRMKPDITGPGENILSTFTLYGGGWLELDGTSMATPYIAGVAALFYHSVGGREKLCAANPAAVAHRRIVQSGNVVRHANWTDADGAIGQQGAGLVDALKVVTSRTSVVPAIINLNDTANFAATHTITIKNSDDVEVSYNLTHANAPTVLTRGQGDAYIDNYPELRTDRGLASVKFSEDAITIPAKSSATVQLTFTEPIDLEEKFLAQYGGYVHVIGDNGETVKITYNGVRGSFKDAQSWETQFGVPAFYDANDQTFRNGTVFPFPTLPKIHFNILWSTREVSFDVVKADWTRADWKYPPKSGENNWVGSTRWSNPATGTAGAFPSQLQPRSGEIFLFTLGDTYATGEPVEPGAYRILARALRSYGDYNNIEDWQIRVSNAFVIGQPEGAEDAVSSSVAVTSSVVPDVTIEPIPTSTAN